MSSGARATIVTESFSEFEGNMGQMTDVDVCLILNDIQGGLFRDIVFTLTVDFSTAGNYAFK